MKTYLISFPKCGRTWITLFLGKYYAEYYNLPFKKNPEMIFHLDKMREFDDKIPSITRSHAGDPMHKKPSKINNKLLDWKFYKNKKVIFLVRDPRDVIVSFYFQVMKRVKTDIYKEMRKIGKNGISPFIRNEKGGIKSIIKYFDLINKNKNKMGDYLLVKYEDLKNNTEDEFIRILKFIGGCDINKEYLEKSIKFSSFGNMHKMEKNSVIECKLSPGNKNDPESYKTRRGIVGGYIDYLNEKDVNYIDKMTERFSDNYNCYKRSSNV